MTLSPYIHQRVSNLIAQDVLSGLEAFLATSRCHGPETDFVKVYGDAYDRDELLERLRESGLAQAIAAGPDLLPDPAERGDWLSRRLYILLRPRNHRQLARQVAFNLDWYLSPSHYPPFPLNPLPFCLVIALASCVIAEIYERGHPAALPELLIPSLLFVLFTLVLLTLASYASRGPRWQAQLFFAQALFDYLLETYTDAPEDEGETAAEDKYGLSWG